MNDGSPTQTATDAILTSWGERESLDGGIVTESGTLISEHDGVSIGIWEATPGSWHSTKDGFTEFMHFVSGSGYIEDQDGIWTIVPGAVRNFPDGWSGTWHVKETVRKVFVIIQGDARTIDPDSGSPVSHGQDEGSDPHG